MEIYIRERRRTKQVVGKRCKGTKKLDIFLSSKTKYRYDEYKKQNLRIRGIVNHVKQESWIEFSKKLQHGILNLVKKV